MKAYEVLMLNDNPVSLNKNPDPPVGSDWKEFDDKQDAIKFAKSVRKNWGQVDVRQTQNNKVIASIQGNDMYEGNKRTRLSEDE